MEESVTYQAIMEKGEVRAFHTGILDLGQDHLGPPDAETARRLRSITDVKAPTAASADFTGLHLTRTTGQSVIPSSKGPGMNLEESVTYQAIVEEGRILERHDVLLQLGSEKFGPPSEAVEMAVRSIIHGSGD